MMRKSRRHLWFLFVAVLATAGMVSTAGAASACGTKDGGTPRACCADLPSPDRGCCDPVRPARATSDAAPSVLPVDSSSCDCRASEPATPADHRNRASSDRPETAGFGVSAAVAPSTGPPPQIDLSTLPTERPPKIPVYLRTSRLLN